MIKIQSYEISLAGRNIKLTLPVGAVPIAVEYSGSVYSMQAVVDTEAATEDRWVNLMPTNVPMPFNYEGGTWQYIAKVNNSDLDKKYYLFVKDVA
jgi:hypothetical protein